MILCRISEEMLTSIFSFFNLSLGLLLTSLLCSASARKTHNIYQKKREAAQKKGRDNLSGVFDKAVFLKHSPFSFNRTRGNKDGKVCLAKVLYINTHHRYLDASQTEERL